MKVVRLADEVDVLGYIQEREYEDALLVGPAILAPIERIAMAQTIFEGPPDSLFIEVEEGQRIVGAIGLVGVTFRRCRFDNVGVMGTAETIAFFRERLQNPLLDAEESEEDASVSE
ncbi:MAG TPA: hypothetical protein VK988_14395 [Acidimicrobiales bacterium]|nr:hypothetical protein [Acidimicrobiales bacterium]